MIRRERHEDGSQTVWTEMIVRKYDAAGALLSLRALTDEESVEFETWADAQPDGATRLRIAADAAQARRALT